MLTFTSATPAMVHFALTAPPRRIRRLRYRAGSESITFTYTYPEPRSSETVNDRARKSTKGQINVEEGRKRSWMEELEGMLDKMDANKGTPLGLEPSRDEASSGVKSESGERRDGEDNESLLKENLADIAADDNLQSTEASASFDLSAERAVVAEAEIMVPDR